MLLSANISSSCVQEAVYDTDEKVLSITYPSGNTYDYIDVPESVFDELSKASSAGSYLNSVIKPTYAYL